MDSYNQQQVPNNSTTRSTASFVLGIISLFSGWVLLPPLIGLYLGIQGRKLEPLGQRAAKWGIALNTLCLLIWVVLVVLFVLLIGVGNYARPSGS